ncbi:MAG: FHA domain-containing protein [Bacteroidales bacterium]|nr:FHA domain-containing protein [Bacteroidales bacterium]
MSLEIKVGRKVSGAFDITVPAGFTKTSREHLKIVCENGLITLFDLETSNGTYVNGRRVSKCELKEGDAVLLGSKDTGEAYKLDAKTIAETFKKIEEVCRTDYVREFAIVKKVFEDFNKEINKIRNKSQKKGQLPKIIISVSIGVVLLIVTICDVLPENWGKVQYPLMMIIMAVAGVITFTGNTPDIKDQITELELKYQDKYVCPKCKKPFNLNTHWKKIQKNKECPHGCGAIFE